MTESAGTCWFQVVFQVEDGAECGGKWRKLAECGGIFRIGAAFLGALLF